MVMQCYNVYIGDDDYGDPIYTVNDAMTTVKTKRISNT